MMPSEDKVRALINRAVKAVETNPQIKVVDPSAVRRAIRAGVEEGVKSIEAIHETAHKKIASLSRKIPPNSREYDELYRKYVSEEYKRRGF